MAADINYLAESTLVPSYRRAIVLFVLALGSLVLLYWPTAAWLASEWFSSESLFEHGILIAAISTVLFLRTANYIDSQSARPFWPALLPVLVLSMLWLLARVANVALAQSLVLPFLLLFVLITALGLRAARSFAPPVLFFVFALPVWEILKPPLRDLTIIVVEFFLRMGNVPAIIHGAVVQVPAGAFRIASGCSGVNFLVVSLALSALYGYLLYESIRKRIILIVVGAATALLCNWIRVATIIAIGNATDMQSTLVHNHQTLGWILFALLLVPFYLFAAWMGRGESLNVDRSKAGFAGPDLPVHCWIAAIAALAVLASGPAYARLVGGKYAINAEARLELPVGSDGWDGPFGAASSWRPKYVGAAGEIQGHYLSANGPVWLYNNIYLSQDQDRELVYVHNRIDAEFEPENAKTTRVVLDSERTFTVRDMVVDEGFRIRRIMYWYEINGRRVSDDAKAKVLQSFAVLQGKPEAGLVAVSALCGLDCTEAGDTIRDFIVSMGDALKLEYEVVRGDSE